MVWAAGASFMQTGNSSVMFSRRYICIVLTEGCMVHDSGLLIPLCQGDLWPRSRTLSSCTCEDFIRTAPMVWPGSVGQEWFEARIPSISAEGNLHLWRIFDGRDRAI